MSEPEAKAVGPDGTDTPDEVSGVAPGQRFGRITDRQPSGSGSGGRMGTYFVQDDATGEIRSFDYSDIVTEGFRTIRTSERVRYLTDPARSDHATYVIRLDLPDVEVTAVVDRDLGCVAAAHSRRCGPARRAGLTRW
jgi:hypothetical protein